MELDKTEFGFIIFCVVLCLTLLLSMIGILFNEVDLEKGELDDSKQETLRWMEKHDILEKKLLNLTIELTMAKKDLEWTNIIERNYVYSN